MNNYREIQVYLEKGEKWPESVWEIHSLTTREIYSADTILVYKNGKSLKERVYKDRYEIYS